MTTPGASGRTGDGLPASSQVVIPAAATGVGSMPGESVAEATAVIAGELTELPHLPELPARGAGADIIGRTAALLSSVSSDLGVETTATGWRWANGPTRVSRRARSWLSEDVDRAEEVFGGSDGFFKVQLCGPWTLAAVVEASRGGPSLRDRGLVAEVAAALSDAASAHVADVRRRLPARHLVLQVDEPALPAVLEGGVASASGMSRLPAVPAGEVGAALQRVIDAVGVPAVLHCCAEFPFEVSRGFAGISWDIARTPEPADPVAEAFEAGQHLILGAVTTRPSRQPSALLADAAWRRVVAMWRRTGLAPAGLARVGFSPACGLAGADPLFARNALTAACSLRGRAESGEY